MSNPLESLLYPESVALVGASNNPQKMGMLPTLSIIGGGYRGKVYPVNRKEPQVLGKKAYKTVDELPEIPDLGIIIVPTEYVIGLVDEFGNKGTKNLIIVSAGFKELGSKGKELEQELNDTAKRHGIRFIGPNCLGAVNTEIGFNSSGISIDESPGKLGFLSHSGTYVAQTHGFIHKMGIRYSKAISLGNEANIDMIEALEFLGNDDQTKAISLYMEGISNGKRFIEVARKVSQKKPVLAHYSGGSAAGARASSSHTGAMAGPDHLFDGIFAQAGVIRVHSIEELYMHGWALATQPPLKGKRIAIITNSGGPGTSIANTCNQAGLDVPRFTEDLQKDIRQHLFEHAPSGNPVDVTFTLDMNILGHKIPEEIVNHGEADGFIIHGTFTSGMLKANHHNLKGIIDLPIEDIIAQFPFDPSEIVAFPWKHNVPYLVSSFFDHEDNYTEALHKDNIPVFHGPEKAADAMISFWKRNRITEKAVSAAFKFPEKNSKASDLIDRAVKNGQNGLDEHGAKELLGLYGIPVTKEALASTEKEAVVAAQTIGYPVALKACQWEIQHKTGKGLMALGIESEEELKAALKEIKTSAGNDIPVLIQEMVKGKREYMTGMTRFDTFGPAVIFGFGGIFTEIINDSSLRVAPFAKEDGLEMIQEIKTSPMLDEFRGLPSVDKNSIADILQMVGFIALLHPEIKEMDLNPIIIRGDESVVADALIVL